MLAVARSKLNCRFLSAYLHLRVRQDCSVQSGCDGDCAGRRPSLYELEEQCPDRVYDRRSEDALRRTVLVRIDVISEQPDIQKQAGHRDGRDLRLIRPEKKEEIMDRERWIKLYKIVNYQADNRCHQPKDQPEPKVVFFEYHDFHVFSSLLFRT